MQRLTITLMNMYQAENSLFDDLALPKHVVKNDFLQRLMIEAGELEVYITRPEILKMAIGSWSRGKLPAWERIADIYDFEYNPIWNVDGEVVHSGTHSTESEDDRNTERGIDREYNRTRNETMNHEGSGESSTTKTETSSGNKNETLQDTKNETTTSQLAADNVESWSNDTKTVSDITDNQTKNTKEGQTVNGSESSTTSDEAEDNTRETIGDTDVTSDVTTDSGSSRSSGSDAWTERRTGNIGVTTTQKMMTEEYDFWNKYDLYGYLIQEFKREFCLLVY